MMATDTTVSIPDTLPSSTPDVPGSNFAVETIQQLDHGSEAASSEDMDDELGRRSAGFSEWIQGSSACFVSMASHILLLVALGLVGLDNSIKAEVQAILAAPVVERPEDEPVEIVLREEISVVESSNAAMT